MTYKHEGSLTIRLQFGQLPETDRPYIVKYLTTLRMGVVSGWQNTRVHTEVKITPYAPTITGRKKLFNILKRIYPDFRDLFVDININGYRGTLNYLGNLWLMSDRKVIPVEDVWRYTDETP